MRHPIRLAACAASLAVVGTGCGRGGGPSVAAPARVGDGVYVAGDHRDTASIQGALVSGHRVAGVVLADLDRG